MQFNTYLFVVFLAIVVAVHHAPLAWTTKKRALLLFSYVFYGAWNPLFVLLLWGSTVVDWFVAKRLAHTEAQRARRALLGISLAFNLGMLVFFKYTGFLQQTLVDVAALAGVHLEVERVDIVLPIGISFYTFMTISYVLDVYRRRAPPARNFLDYALYVTFFPHLVSGPIVRATELVPQFEIPRTATARQFAWGGALVVLGLFEKVVVADGLLAPAVEAVYATSVKAVTTFDAWLGTLAFAGQIFCDFAGYSTCAIGVSLCLGFALPDNFRFPYAAIGFSDFWRRWHISLSAWLRDYVYIALGGNRHGVAGVRFMGTRFNLLATMLIGGLWHGASWTFVVWGALHGVYLVVERLVRDALPSVRLGVAGRIAVGALTFACVCVAWVFFRATTFAQAFRIVAALFGVSAADGAKAKSLLDTTDVLCVVVPVGALLLAHALMRDTTFERVVERTPWPVRAVVLSLLLVAIALFPGPDRAFIYFQF